MTICKSCGEYFDGARSTPAAPHLTPQQERALLAERQSRCPECAAEIVTGYMPTTTTMHGTGGGRRVVRDARGLS